MSTLGDAYDYDVFFSYAWAGDTGDQHMREWSRKIADTIRTLLSQRFNRGDVRLNAFLDRDVLRGGQDLDRELKSAVQRSGILVAMVSDHYASPYCQKELNWFCEGLTEANFADHVCILRMQEVSEGLWPAALQGTDAKPRLFIDFCDERGQPINMAGFILSGSLADLVTPINRVVVEIADKITAMQKKISAREAYVRSQKLPVEPVIFLEAEQADLEQWMWCSAQLRAVPSIIWPQRAPVPATAVVNGEEYDGCEALLLLRSRVDDDIGRRIKAAYLSRRKLYRDKEQTIPWALLDLFDDPPPESDAFHLPRVPLKGDWLPVLRGALREA